MLNTEACIGLRFQRSAVQLYEVNAGFLVIEENEFQNAVRTLQLNLLWIGIDDVLRVGCYFLRQIGTGLQISQEDLTELTARMGDYLDEFEKNGVDRLTVEES